MIARLRSAAVRLTLDLFDRATMLAFVVAATTDEDRAYFQAYREVTGRRMSLKDRYYALAFRNLDKRTAAERREHPERP